MDYSIHAPSLYISTHLKRLLPTWNQPARSVVVVLQACTSNLLEKTRASEEQKWLLRQRFLEFGYPIATALQDLGYLADLFDPCTGLPLLSRSGQLGLDDVAVACACLGYDSARRYGCSIMLHPVWGSAVYPSTLLSSAPSEQVEQAIAKTESVLL